jgi:hypothetical protein
LGPQDRNSGSHTLFEAGAKGRRKTKKREKRKGGVRENSLLVSGPLSTRRTIPRPDSDGGPISYLYGIRVEQGSRGAVVYVR